jgi:anti-sigma factor RsiW
MPRQMAAVGAHVRDCARCRTLLEELKAVDGLLFTTREPELPQNFTFAVMAELNTLPAPRARQHPVWSFLALYCAASWVAAVAAMAISGTSPGAVFSFLSPALSRAGVISGGFAASASQGLTHTAPALAAFSIGALFIDVTIAAVVGLLYFTLRPRLAARIASSAEASS